MISFDNVSLSYPSGNIALRNITLHIPEGQFVCLVGGNGSGKSTLAKLINALLAPTSGTVQIDGISARDASSTIAIRSTVGMVMQNPDDQIIASIVEDDVAFGPENLGVHPHEIRKRIESSLKKVGLAGFESASTHELSGGQKQRLAIAGALAMEPKALILDEATSMLDPKGRRQVLDVCRSLNESGSTIVMITHRIDEVMESHRVIALEGGSIAFDGTPGQFISSPEALRLSNAQAPFATRLANELSAMGFSVGACETDEQLISQIIQEFGLAR